jgi:hypothetical protein
MYVSAFKKDVTSRIILSKGTTRGCCNWRRYRNTSTMLCGIHISKRNICCALTNEHAKATCFSQHRALQGRMSIHRLAKVRKWPPERKQSSPPDTSTERCIVPHVPCQVSRIQSHTRAALRHVQGVVPTFRRSTPSIL